jgi:arabinofuranosyltransferase
MTRLDLLLLVFPVLIFCFFQQPNKWKAIKYGFLALSPLIAWEIFSYIYYGYLFPNTYYAKINSGISSTELILQGFFYFIASLKRDPLTILMIFFGIIFGLLNKNMIIRLFTIGLLLFLFYIIKIGGDFMVGRFLVIPFLISIFVLFVGFISNLDGPKIVLTSLLIIIVGILSPIPTYQQLNPEGYFEGYHGIVDEREIYYYGTSLFRYGVVNFEPSFDWIEDGRELNRKVEGFEYHLQPYLSIGYLGYYAGPKIYIIDRSGLGNAFLAHQPITDFTDWRIGHYERSIEEDFLMSLEHGKNLIIDKELARLYDDVQIRTQCDVFDMTRLSYILNIDNIQ